MGNNLHISRVSQKFMTVHPEYLMVLNCFNWDNWGMSIDNMNTLSVLISLTGSRDIYPWLADQQASIYKP